MPEILPPQRVTVKQITGYISIVLSAGFFALLSPLSKLLLNGVPPIQLVFYGLVCSSIAMFVILLINDLGLHLITRGNRSITQNFTLSKKQLVAFIIYGLSGVLFSKLFFISAFKFTSVPHVIFIFYLYPLIVIILSRIFFYESITIQKILALILGLLGSFLILISEGSTAMGNKWGLGETFALISALFWSFYMIQTKKVKDEQSSFKQASWGFFIALLPLLFYSICIRDPGFLSTLKYADLKILLIYCVAQLLAYITLIYGVQHTPVGNASILMLIEPVAASILAYIILKESLTKTAILGCFIVLLSSITALTSKGSILSGSKRRRRISQ